MIRPWEPLYRFLSRLSLDSFVYDLVGIVRVFVQGTEVVDLVVRCIRF